MRAEKRPPGDPPWTSLFVQQVHYRVQMELLPDGRMVDRTVRTGWGELQAAALAAVFLTMDDPGARIRTLSVEVISRDDGNLKADIYDPVGTGEKGMYEWH